jgi:hypothetical protein
VKIILGRCYDEQNYRIRIHRLPYSARCCSHNDACFAGIEVVQLVIGIFNHLEIDQDAGC